MAEIMCMEALQQCADDDSGQNESSVLSMSCRGDCMSPTIAQRNAVSYPTEINVFIRHSAFHLLTALRQ